MALAQMRLECWKCICAISCASSSPYAFKSCLMLIVLVLPMDSKDSRLGLGGASPSDKASKSVSESAASALLVGAAPGALLP